MDTSRSILFPSQLLAEGSVSGLGLLSPPHPGCGFQPCSGICILSSSRSLTRFILCCHTASHSTVGMSCPVPRNSAEIHFWALWDCGLWVLVSAPGAAGDAE